MVNKNCAYCMEGELVDAFGIKICDIQMNLNGVAFSL